MNENLRQKKFQLLLEKFLETLGCLGLGDLAIAEQVTNDMLSNNLLDSGGELKIPFAACHWKTLRRFASEGEIGLILWRMP